MTAAGLALPGVGRIEIHCDPTNLASAAIPRTLGYRHVRTVTANRLTPLGGLRDTVVFELTEEDHRATIRAR